MIPWRKLAKGDARAAERVLVIQLGELGDFVRALSAAKRLREHHVGARITLLTHEGVRELAEKCPFFDTVESDGKPKEAQAITQLITRIRNAKYDIVYDLEGSQRTNNYFRALKLWTPLWSGPVSGASHAYLDPQRATLHPLDRLGAQLQAAGVGDGELAPPDLGWLRAALRDPPRLKPDFFGIRSPYVVFLPRGSDALPARRWPEAKYIDLAGRLLAGSVTPVVMGAADERAIGAAVAQKHTQAKNLVTRADVFQCVGLFERAAFVLGDDVDLMHLAAAAGAPCLTFLSSSADPDQAAPRGKGGVVAFTAAVVGDLPIEQVERQLRNCGILARAAGAA